MAVVSSRAGAQPSERVPRVGLLWITSAETQGYTEYLRRGLQARGYVPGRNIILDESFAVSHYDGLGGAAKRLVEANVDVIVCYGATATQAAMRETKRIPIVFISGSDPVKNGFVSDLAHPGGNVTGVTSRAEELISKKVELFRTAFPLARRAGLLHYPGSPAEVRQIRIYQEVAQVFKVEIVPSPVPDPASFDAVMAWLRGNKVDAMIVLGSTMFVAHQAQLVAAIEKSRIPAMYSQPTFVDKGGLISYGANSSLMISQASAYIDKIVRGARPGDLAVEQENRFELVVNLKAAKALGIALPREVVAAADRVIE